MNRPKCPLSLSLTLSLSCSLSHTLTLSLSLTFSLSLTLSPSLLLSSHLCCVTNPPRGSLLRDNNYLDHTLHNCGIVSFAEDSANQHPFVPSAATAHHSRVLNRPSCSRKKELGMGPSLQQRSSSDVHALSYASCCGVAPVTGSIQQV